MKDNILVKIIAVIVFGLILGTCEFDSIENSKEVRLPIVKTDSIKNN